MAEAIERGTLPKILGPSKTRKMITSKLPGRILVPPHGELIQQRKKKAILSTVKDEQNIKIPVYIVSGGKVWAKVVLAPPIAITAEDFKRTQAEHKVSAAEMDAFGWRGKQLYTYYFQLVETYVPPLECEQPKGAQRWIKGVKFKGEAPKEIAQEVFEEAQHRKDQCMSCDAKPTKQVLWAEGMAVAWFCDKHYKEFLKKRSAGDDVIKLVNINGEALSHEEFKQAPNQLKGKGYEESAFEEALPKDMPERAKHIWNTVHKTAYDRYDPKTDPNYDSSLSRERNRERYAHSVAWDAVKQQFKKVGEKWQKKEAIEEVIKKVGDKWELWSRDGTKRLGTFDTREDALRRERQIQFFKHLRAALVPELRKFEPDSLKELDDEMLLKYHDELHQLQHIVAPEEDVVNGHVFVLEELERRHLEHPAYDDALDRRTLALLQRKGDVEETELFYTAAVEFGSSEQDWVEATNRLPRPLVPFVVTVEGLSLVGSMVYAEAGASPNDADWLARSSWRFPRLEDDFEKRFKVENHFVYETKGPNWDYWALGDFYCWPVGRDAPEANLSVQDMEARLEFLEGLGPVKIRRHYLKFARSEEGFQAWIHSEIDNGVMLKLEHIFHEIPIEVHFWREEKELPEKWWPAADLWFVPYARPKFHPLNEPEFKEFYRLPSQIIEAIRPMQPITPMKAQVSSAYHKFEFSDAEEAWELWARSLLEKKNG